MPSKYDSLARHLLEKDQDMLRMSFKEVEAVLKDDLPPAARKHRAWWANNDSNNAARHGWLKAGWESSQVDMDNEELVFVRRLPALYSNVRLRAGPRVDKHSSISKVPRSLDAQLAEILRAAGGVENLYIMVGAIKQYIAGDLIETELGQILRQHWPRGT